MRMGSLLITGMLFLGVTSATAQDQVKEPRFEAFIQGGPSFFSSQTERVDGPIVFFDSRHSFGVSGRLFTGVRYYFDAKDALEASYAYSANRMRTRTTIRIVCPPGFICPLIPEGTFSASEPTHIHSVAFNYVRYFRDTGRVRPFATAGLGFSVFNTEFSGTRELAGNFGGGADFRMADKVSLRAELRDYVIERSSLDSLGSRALTHNIVPSVGLVFKLVESPPRAPQRAKIEDERFPFEIFVEGGASWFSGRPARVSPGPLCPSPPCSGGDIETKASFATTGRFTVGVRYYFTNNDAVESSYSFTPTRLQLSSTSIDSQSPVGFFSTSVDVHNNSFNYVRYFSRKGRLAPFVTGGLGYSVFSPTFDTVTKFAGNFGGGVDVQLHRRVYLRGELRDFITDWPAFAFTFAPSGGTTHNVVPSLGLAFKLR